MAVNTKHGWKIHTAMHAIEELHGACPNVRVKIGDVKIDQHFFCARDLFTPSDSRRAIH